MSKAELLPSLPPSLPCVAFRRLGVAALSFSAASFGAASLAFSLWRDQARFLEGLPPGTISGGAAFSLNFVPLVTTFAAVALGLVGLLLLAASCGAARRSKQRVLSGLHLTAILLLFPSFYFLVLFVSRIISINSQ